MDVDFANLDKSEFWKEKIDRAVQVRDANKSGTLSRADFMLILGPLQTTEKLHAAAVGEAYQDAI